MKKVILLTLLAFTTTLSLYAQVTPFKVELGGLYALPTESDAYKAGIGFYLHPSYFVGDQINIGIKAEGAVIGAADVEGMSVSLSAIASYLATANYYFAVNKVRPYFGLGVGIYRLGSSSITATDGGSIDVEFGDKFGIAPKVGLDLGHFTLNASYNYIIGQEEEFTDKSYFTVGIGVFFGGGVKGKGSNKNKIISIDDDEDF